VPEVSDALVSTAEVVLACNDLAATLPFFTDTLGFRLDVISPADAPNRATLSGYGLRIRLEPGERADAGRLRLRGADPAAVAGGPQLLVAPNGTRVELVAADPGLVVPPLVPAFTVSRAADASDVTGRAGMRYRDLIPDRQGGRFIASLIGIPDGGPVPDAVHFHRIRFQMIYCRRGWVRVVYEDQGPPFELRAGDCVLQPPEIRHRVLEASPGLEVVELTTPAVHDTILDHELALPTPQVRPERDFGGQRFVRHEAARAEWTPWRLDGFEARDLGLGAATRGLAAAHVARFHHAAPSVLDRHDGELRFLFVLDGSLVVHRDGEPVSLGEGDAVVIPPGLPHTLSAPSADLQLLEVDLPAATLDGGQPGRGPGAEASREVMDVREP
jgi:quercetin dioxygenase-like cupin family protein